MDILLCDKFDDAVVACIVKKWTQISKIPLGRTIIQKICYFLKSKGVPLDYDFDIYHYGPYSQDLYFRMDDLVVDGIVNDATSHNPQIKSNKSEYKPGSNTDELISRYEEEISEYLSAIDDVINLFKELNHTHLELLSTVHYFHTSLTNYYQKQASKNEIMGKVKAAKGDKFDFDDISSAYDVMEKAGILNWDGSVYNRLS